MRSRSTARATALVLLGVTVLQFAWLMAIPAFHGMDEFDHAYRAASVARGHWEPGRVAPPDGRGQLIRVPVDIVTAAHDACAGLDYTGPDNCRPVSSVDAAGQVDVASAAATYNPIFYALVGVAALPFHGDGAVLAMRVATALLCDAFLVAALIQLSRRGERWQVAALALACTPTLVYASVVAAPNAVGFTASLLMWFSVVALPSAPASPVPRGALASLVIGAGAVMCTHSTGPMWVALAALCSLPLTWPRLKALWSGHRRSAVISLAILTIWGLACVSWIVYAGTNDPRSEPTDLGAAPAKVLLAGPLLWLLQSIAALRMRDQAAPPAVYAVGLAVLIVMLGAALRVADRRSRWVMGAIVVAGTAIPLALTWMAYPHVGAAWQGRYTLPLTYGLLVVASVCLARRGSPGRVVCAVLTAALALAHTLTLDAVFDLELTVGPSPTGSHALFAVSGLAAWALLYAGLRTVPESPSRD